MAEQVGLKIQVEAKAIKLALQAVSKSVQRGKEIAPILKHVLLDVRDGRARLMATNLDQMAGFDFECQVLGEGAICVRAETALALVSRLKGTLTLWTENGQLHINDLRGSAQLQTLPADDFPQMPEIENPLADFEISKGLLAAGLASVKYAISKEETRYYLTGVYMECKAGGLIFTATDGHRLATREVTCNRGDDFPGALIPAAAVDYILGQCDRADSSVNIRLNDSKIEVQAGADLYRAKLIDGNFPDWRRVIPSGEKYAVSFDRKALLDAVNLVASISSGKTRSVKISFDGDDLLVTTPSGEHGDRAQARVEMSVDSAADAKGEVGFNSRYVADMLGQVSDESVTMSVRDPSGPILFKTSLVEFRQVIMTLRV